jgi:hypothetical protein
MDRTLAVRGAVAPAGELTPTLAMRKVRIIAPVDTRCFGGRRDLVDRLTVPALYRTGRASEIWNRIPASGTMGQGIE